MPDSHESPLDDLTPVQRRRRQSSSRILDCPAERIAYQHTVLCQTCLPYRDPGHDVRLWEREQGRVSLLLEAGRAKDPVTGSWIELGLPGGNAR